MNATHHTESDEHGDYDVLEDGVSGLRLMVRRVGAEMVSLARRGASGEWVGFLYRDGETGPPVSGWANHATVMGYYVHRLVDQETHYRGGVIRGGNHGFLRNFVFGAPEFRADRGSITYRVAADAIPEGAYPLRVAMELTYRLDGERLQVEFLFINEEPEGDAHVSFGLHPGFAVGSVADAEVLLPAGTYVRYWAPDNFLNGREERIPFGGGPMPFAREDLPGSFLLGMDEILHPVIVLRDPVGKREMRLDYTGVPFVTIWSDLSPMICVEPCWGMPDSRPQRPFEEKVGIQRVPAGGTLRATCAMTPHLLE